MEITVCFEENAKLCRNTDVCRLNGNETDLQFEEETHLQTEVTHCIELERKAFVYEVELFGTAAVSEHAEPVDKSLADLIFEVRTECNVDVCARYEEAADADLDELQVLRLFKHLDLAQLKPAVVLFLKHFGEALGEILHARAVFRIVEDMYL